MKSIDNRLTCIVLLLVFQFMGLSQDNRIKLRERFGIQRVAHSSQTMANNYMNRKIMPHRKNKTWVLGTENSPGHWAKPILKELKQFKEKKIQFPYTQGSSQGIRSYAQNRKSYLNRSFGTNPFNRFKMPAKSINLAILKEDTDFVHKRKSARNLHGKPGTNVYYFKKIGKKDFTSFSSVYDHIVVTDTLYGPAGFLNTDGKPRSERRSYIKIIANCIVYDGPLRPASARSATTDYVFSAKEVIYRSPYKDLTENELKPFPPFVDADTNIKLHRDPFGNKERILLNRLYLEILDQIITELNVATDWEKDRLLLEFQKYRGKVNTDVLRLDENRRDQFNNLCNQVKANYGDFAQQNIRSIDDQVILMEATINEFSDQPFKYFALPTKSVLIPKVNNITGKKDKLGSLFYEATGEAGFRIQAEVKLDYNIPAFDVLRKKVAKEGFTLDKWPPAQLMQLAEQPLKINGKTIGRIIPIDYQHIRLDINIPDNSIAINELFPTRTTSTFDLIIDLHSGSTQRRVIFPMEIPAELKKQIDSERITDMFTSVENNRLTEQVKLSSQLLPVHQEEGALRHLEVTLEFSFDNGQKIFHGPFNLSSSSTLASEVDIHFIKHSENYQIKISGTAFYEGGEFDIKKGTTSTSKFIQLDESMLETVSQ